ncbi:Flp pilus assembly protein CpaB [Sphingomonas panacisoli]|uniref:Flp pilus assembly protein CpaB n=1 Tax=Sphingomonas panacisoli TaxID=1813879 RepID=A0A5B8LMP4_9SPHN|nr:Flp pilus assembly protein CpaB [Sphingomonas panacisoli]QDZ08652.1 Flp pilus assembly protein CpaB [Sphingomonas panacisoli]
MRGQGLIILGVAILIGLAAVFLANTYLGKVEERQATAPQGMVKVAVARVPLEFGTVITPDKVNLIDLPQDALPEGTFSTIPQLLPANGSRVALRPMAVNEPILRSKISGEGGRAAISAVLKPDMRAAAVRVSDVAGVGGFVLPGDVVDVLVTRTPMNNNGGGQITDILLQKIRVIAIDQDASDSTDKPVVGKTATLEVSQIDSQKLALAQQVGQISLVLANPAAETNPSVATVSVDDLRDGAFVSVNSDRGSRYQPPPGGVPMAPRAPRVAKRPAPKGDTSTILVVRGTKDSSYEVLRYGAR